MKRNIKLTVLITLLGTFGAIALIPYQLNVLEGVKEQLGGLPLPVAIALGVLQTTILVFILTLLGLRLQDRAGLDVPHLRAWLDHSEQPAFSWKWLGLGILVSFLGSLLIMFLDVYVFMPQIISPEIADSSQRIWWHGLLAMFYGGLTEEIMVRLFGMTFIVWLLAKIMRKEKGHIPTAYYWFGIVLAALLFGAGHLPATAQVFGELSAIIVMRALLLNGLLGIWFGYLYWRKGLEYAMLAHMSADFFLHVLFVILF